jgi:hypothetical protein
MMPSIVKKIALRLLITKQYIWTKRSLSKRVIKSTKTVFFDLSDIRQEPYYFPIIFSFHEAGYSVFIADRLKFIGHSFAAAKFIYSLSNVFIRTKPPESCALIITDSKRCFDQSERFLKRIYLRAAAHASALNEVFLPYPMHPNAYHKRYFEQLPQLRSKDREVRVLFSGNTEPGAYTNPIIATKYKKLNRVEVIHTLITQMPPDHVIVISEVSNKEGIPKPYFGGVVLYNWQWSAVTSTGLDIRVPNDQWLQFLASGDFFLCCPGIVIPQSHNAIEAMAVGTIPILQYPELFHPALQDGLNCITYTTKEDLVLKINSCLAKTKAEIESLRNEVIHYYERYLHHRAACQMIEAMPEGKNEVSFYNEAI